MNVEGTSPNYWRFIGRSPERRGVGGEHTVFAASMHTGYLAKINNLYLQRSINGEITKQDIEQEILKRTERQSALRRSFGDSHILNDYFGVIDVTLTTEEVINIVPEASLPQGISFHIYPTMVVFQKAVPELEGAFYTPNKPLRKVVSLGDRKYAEERFDPRDPESFTLYEAASDYLVLGRGDMPSLPRYSHSGIWAPSTWKDLQSFDWRSPAMQKLSTGFLAFTRNTAKNGGGEALDLTGENNILIYPYSHADPKTDFKLIDALYPSPPLTMQQISDLLLMVNGRDMPVLSPSEKAKLTNGVNYLRTANAIIDFSDSGLEFLHPFPDDIAWRPDIWRRVFTLCREFLQERGHVNSIPTIL